MHYYQHHIGDYRRDTNSLSLLQHGVYRLLLDEYYATEKPLPADAELLWRICGAVNKVEKLAVAMIAERFFQLSDGMLRHKRVDSEVDTYKGMLETAAKAGRASAEKRQRKGNARSTPVGFPLQREGNAPPNEVATNHEPITNNHSSPLLAREGTVSERPPTVDEVLGYAKGNAAGVLRTDVCMAWMDARERDGWKREGRNGHMIEFEDWRADLRTYHRIFLENESDKKSRGRGNDRHSPPAKKDVSDWHNHKPQSS